MGTDSPIGTHRRGTPWRKSNCLSYYIIQKMFMYKNRSALACAFMCTKAAEEKPLLLSCMEASLQEAAFLQELR